jgi:hypothetical protein
MNIPGFTAEQSLKQHQASYAQRSTGQPVAAVGEVRPQIIHLPADFLFTVANLCCLNGNLGCCKMAGEMLAHSLGSR